MEIDDFKELFPKRLKEMRLKRGKKQDDLAEATGLGRSAIAMYESGRNFPLTETFIALSKSLDTSIDYLLGKTHDPEPFHSNNRQAIDLGTLKDLPLVYNGRVLSLNERKHITNLVESAIGLIHK